MNKKTTFGYIIMLYCVYIYIYCDICIITRLSTHHVTVFPLSTQQTPADTGHGSTRRIRRRKGDR